MNYQIEFLKECELSKVQSFINNEWKKSHILSTSKELFKWQYQNKNLSYNFVVAKDKGEILGILGFIPTNKYDENLNSKNVIWLALWKVTDKFKVPGLGLKMLIYLENNVKHCLIAVNGINSKIAALYKMLGYKSNNLNHYYVTNSFSELNLIKSPKSYVHPKIKNGKGHNWELIKKDETDKLKISLFNSSENELAIKKSLLFFINRYINHPFYNYFVYLIYSYNKKNAALISLRFDSKNDIKVLRIVDYYGSPKILQDSGKGLKEIMNLNNVEYTDFWSFGIQEEIMNSLGFQLVEEKKGIIVPNYFEPFIQENNQILFAYKDSTQKNKDILIFKGDGDQDRPNQL